MPILTGKISDEGPLVDVMVSVPTARRMVLERLQLPVPEPVRIKAVLDTGASISGVDPGVLETLELAGEVDIMYVHTPSTFDDPFPCPVYVVNFSLICGTNLLTCKDMRILASGFRGNEEAQALVGRDVLAHCNFEYLGPEARFILAF
jgi:hypothetical protein